MATTAAAPELTPTDDRAPDWVATGTPARLRDALASALGEDIPAQDGPLLIQARIATGMWLD